MTPLHMACSNMELADILIKAGQNINAKCDSDLTSLYLEGNCPKFVVLLIDKGVNLNSKCNVGNPLHRACQNGDVKRSKFKLLKVDV